MDSSPQQHCVCLSAAVADLSQIGTANLVQDCGSHDCAHCTRIREGSSKVESEDQGQGRLTPLCESPPATSNSRSTSEDDKAPLVLSGPERLSSIAPHRAKKTLEELCGLETFEERKSIDEIVWSAADEEQPELSSENDRRCDFEEDDDYEMVDLDEALLDEARVVEMSRGKGKAIVVRRWFARSSSSD